MPKKAGGHHIRALKMFKGKTRHELQDYIMGLSNHHLAMLDHYAGVARGETSNDNGDYPPMANPQEHREVAQMLKGHLDSAVKLARRVRGMDEKGGGGVAGFFKAVGKGAKTVGKYAAKGLKAAGKWALKNPQLAFGIASTAASVPGIISGLMEKPEEAQLKDQPQAIDDLLAPDSPKGGAMEMPMPRANAYYI